MGIKYKPHFHLYEGATVTITIESIIPPIIVPVVTPVAGVTKETEDDRYNGHEHEKLEFPSLDIGGSFQQQIGSRFMSHMHTEEIFGISLLPPGAFTGFITFSPPPLNASNISEKEKLVEYHKRRYFDSFYKKFPKNQNNNVVKIESYRKFILDYANNHGAKIYEEFKNH